MQPDEVRDAIVAALEDAKAQDIKVMEVTGLTDITDYMILATGTSSRHVKSVADKLVDAMKKRGLRPLGVEGTAESEWVLIDLGDAIVHIMQAEAREFYDLEKLWGEELRHLVESSRES
jgi:ribosome-associated protein